MTGSKEMNAAIEIFFGMYSDGKEGSKDSGHDHLYAFPTNPNDVDQIDYQF